MVPDVRGDSRRAEIGALWRGKGKGEGPAERHPGTVDVTSSALTEAEAAHALVAGQRREKPWERMQVLGTLSSA